MLHRWQSSILILLALIIYGCAPERVPDLTGMTLREAYQRTASDYPISVIGVQESTRPKRTILSQNPRPGVLADVHEDARWTGGPTCQT